MSAVVDKRCHHHAFGGARSSRVSSATGMVYYSCSSYNSPGLVAKTGMRYCMKESGREHVGEHLQTALVVIFRIAVLPRVSQL